MITYCKKLILLIIFLCSAPALTLAAQINLETQRAGVSLLDQFTVNIVINSEESLNAIEGRLTYPTDLVELVDIIDGNSVINFWVEKPHLSGTNTISFSGITPGGFEGSGNKVLSVLFEAKRIGTASFTLSNISTLRNDGLGTAATSEVNSISLLIEKGDGVIVRETPPDLDPPEDFTPSIEKDPNVFDGQYFLVFSTQDKGSGIDHYEIREGSWGQFKIAESPYLLENQKLTKKIFIKAIDKAGNEKSGTIEAQTPLNWWEQYGLFAIILILILGILILRRLWLRFTN